MEEKLEKSKDSAKRYMPWIITGISTGAAIVLGVAVTRKHKLGEIYMPRLNLKIDQACMDGLNKGVGEFIEWDDFPVTITRVA